MYLLRRQKKRVRELPFAGSILRCQDWASARSLEENPGSPCVRDPIT